MSLFNDSFWRFTLGFLGLVTLGLVAFLVFNLVHEQLIAEEINYAPSQESRLD